MALLTREIVLSAIQELGGAASVSSIKVYLIKKFDLRAVQVGGAVSNLISALRRDGVIKSLTNDFDGPWIIK